MKEMEIRDSKKEKLWTKKEGGRERGEGEKETETENQLFSQTK